MKFTGERYLPDHSGIDDELSIEHLHRYHSILPLVKDKVVLDIACGEGYGTELIARYAQSVTGVDISKECIQHATDKYGKGEHKNIQFAQGDVVAIPAGDGEFDVVVSFETVEHVNAAAQADFFKELKRVLKKTGTLVISTPDTENYSQRYDHANPFHEHEMTRKEFSDILSSYFSHVEILEQGFEIVSVIAPAEPSKINNARAIDVQGNGQSQKRKYLIAVASDKKFPANSISSIILDSGKKYLAQVDRILQLQKEVEEMSSWAQQLDKDRQQNEMTIGRLQKEAGEGNREDLQALSGRIEDLKQWLVSQDSYNKDVIGKLNLEIKQLQDAADQQRQLVEIRTALSGDLQQRNDELEKNLLELQTLKAETESQLSGQKEELQLLNDQNDILKKQLESQAGAYLEMVNNAEQLSIQLKEQAELAAETKATITLLQQQLEKEIVYQQSLMERNNRMEERLFQQLQEEEGLQKQKESLENFSLNLTNEIKEKERVLQDLQFNFNLTRQQLSEVNNRLMTIYDSDGWKLLAKYYSIKGKLLNENTRRYKWIKKAFNFLRNKKEPKNIAPAPVPVKREKTAEAFPAAITKKIISEMTIPYFDKPLVSIIIPVYNAWEMNVTCITSIIKNTDGASYEVIVGDDCSTDETSEIGKYFKNVIHVRNEKNLRFLHNCNRAASFARGKYVLFLNNDTEVKPGWLSAMTNLTEQDDKIGVIGSKLVYPDGRLQEAGGIMWNDASAWNFGQGQNPDMPEFNYVKEADYISGASLMVRKDLWDELGGFDTRYAPAYCEDSDLCFAAREKGYKVIYQPLSEVIHYEGYSHGNETQASSISNIKEYQKVNNQKFFEKWKEVLQRDQFPNAVNVFWAKDRSRSRKTLLMVDHYVPHFDKDAGSRTTFQYLELFVRLGFNVKFIGENFYRHEPYTTVLQQMGIEVLYGPWHANNWKQWFLDNREKFDYIYLNRPHISANFIDFFKENSEAKIIYYGHDLHFLREEKRYELEKDDALLTSAARWKEIEMGLFAKSDIILTPSIQEQQLIRGLDAGFNVQLMRPYIYKSVKNPASSFSERHDLLFVGGFNHLPNVDAVFWFINEVWPIVKNQIPSIKFIVAGSNPPLEIQELGGEDIFITGYVSDLELDRLYRTCRIAIVPLRYGAGVKGKTVEAMRYGIPMVTTSFGVEGLPGNYDFIPEANNAEDFAKAIVSLYESEQLLVEQSSLGIQYIKDNFTESVAEEILVKALASA